MHRAVCLKLHHYCWHISRVIYFIFQIIEKALRSPPWLGWPLWNICVTNYHGYVLIVVNTSRSFPRSWLITGFVTKLTRRVSLVEQELSTLPEHLSSPPVFSGVHVTRSLVLYVCFVDRCLSFCTFSFGHCVVCSSSIYGFWLPLWYLQTLLTIVRSKLDCYYSIGFPIFWLWAYQMKNFSINTVRALNWISTSLLTWDRQIANETIRIYER